MGKGTGDKIACVTGLPLTNHESKRWSRRADFGGFAKADGIGGSRYLETVIYQLVDDLYDISEIDDFSPQVKADTLRFVKSWKE